MSCSKFYSSTSNIKLNLSYSLITAPFTLTTTQMMTFLPNTSVIYQCFNEMGMGCVRPETDDNKMENKIHLF